LGKLGTHILGVPEIERLKDFSASAELNPEMLKGYEAALKKMWGELVRPD
jgi:hypothetical protein